MAEHRLWAEFWAELGKNQQCQIQHPSADKTHLVTQFILYSSAEGKEEMFQTVTPILHNFVEDCLLPGAFVSRTLRVSISQALRSLHQCNTKTVLIVHEN